MATAALQPLLSNLIPAELIPVGIQTLYTSLANSSSDHPLFQLKERVMTEYAEFRKPAGVWSQLKQALASVGLISSWAAYIGIMPGHKDGGIVPVYVPEHYGPRNSRNLFDPYR